MTVGTAVLSVISILLLGGLSILGWRGLRAPGSWGAGNRVRGHDGAVGRVRPPRASGESVQPTSPVRRKAKEKEPPVLPPDATVILAEEQRAANVADVLASLEADMIGLRPVKEKVQEIASLLLVDKARLRFGLTAPRPSLHMCFTGPPGTGKTTVALRMAELLRRLGYLEEGQLVHAMRDDLVGEFIGQTAPRTRRLLERAMGGVLFIDEAYNLYRAHDSRDFGQEAIEILIQVMENRREDLVVILAGYRDRMDEFFESNPGMSSRIAHHLDFAPYGVEELLAIGELMLNRTNYCLSGEAEAALRSYLAVAREQPRFAYGRSVRNELERARLRHANRLAAEPHRAWTREELMRLEAGDFTVPSYGVDQDWLRATLS